MTTPAEQLVGMTLEEGWYVEAQIPRITGQTGGAFSTSYRISRGNESGFLKALDFEAAKLSGDPAAKLKELADAYLFERSIAEFCEQRKLSRVIRAKGSGKVMSPGPNVGVVQYLIFELAKGGDVRKVISEQANFDLAWTLKSLHEIFVGVQQLHTNRIAHQDVKPSNILACGDEGHKLADFGRAWQEGFSSPYDNHGCAGSRAYSPPELLYRDASLTDEERRFGADFYMLGSMVVFMFSGMRTTAALMSCLPEPQRWLSWGGTYAEAMPHLEHAFAELLVHLRLQIPNKVLWKEISEIVQQMCHPDIKRRGDREHTAKIGSRFTLQRFVSKFARLAMDAEIGQISIT